MDQPPDRKKRGRGYYYNEEHYRKCQAAKQERFKRNRFVAQTRAKRRGAAQHEEKSWVCELPSDVVEVIEDIENAKKEREKLDIREQLEEIMDRISYALRHCDEKDNVPRTLAQRAEFMEELHAAPEFKMKEKREELNRQQNMLQFIAEYAGNLGERKKITQEVDDWLNSEDVLEGVVSKEKLGASANQYEAINQEIIQAFEYAKEVVERIRKLGYQLLKDAGYIDSDDEEDPSTGKKKKKARITLFDYCDIIDEKGLMESTDNMDVAMAEMKALMEQGIRMVKRQNQKNAMRAGIKQIKLFIKAMQKRMKDSKKKQEEIIHLGLQIDNSAKTLQKYKEENEKCTQKTNACEERIRRLDKKIRDLGIENEELISEIEEMKYIIEHGPREEGSVSSVWSAHIDYAALPPTSNTSDMPWMDAKPVVQSKPQQNAGGGKQPSLKKVVFDQNQQKSGESKGSNKSVVFITDSSMNAATRSLKVSLDEATQKLQDVESKLTKTTKELKSTKAELDEMKSNESIQKAVSGGKAEIRVKINEDATKRAKHLEDKNATLEKQVSKLTTTLANKNEIIQFQEKRLKDMREELGVIEVADIPNVKMPDGKPLPDKIKVTLIRMQRENRDEVGRLKAHIEKEKARHEAEMRKLEQKQKDELNATFKQSSHLLRAINRFKESIAGVLDRESLPVAASDVRKITDLPTDQIQSEAKMLLAQMAGNAVELLVNVEFKLSQALLNRRLEVKENSIAKNFANKDLEAQIEASMKAKQANETMATSLREMKVKLLAAEETIAAIRKFENWRYEGLNKRYKRVMTQLQEETENRDKTERKFKRTLKDIEQKMKSMITKRDGMAKMVGEQQDLITQLHTHISQKREEHFEEMHLSIGDLRQNLLLITRAHAENKISKEMHQTTAELIKASMQLPIAKLRGLFKRYIIYRRLKGAREHLEEQAESNLYKERKPEIRTFITRMDHKLLRAFEKWKEQIYDLEDRKAELLDNMAQAFSTIVHDTGILLVTPKLIGSMSVKITPLSNTGGESPDIHTTTKSKEKTKVKLPLIHRVPEVLNPPKGIKGHSMDLVHAKEAMWKQEMERVDTDELPPIIKVTPHFVNYEVNKYLKAAQRTLAHMYNKATYPMHAVKAVEICNSTVVPFSDTATFIGSSGDTDFSNQDTWNDGLSQADDSVTTDSGVFQSDSKAGTSTHKSLVISASRQ